MTNIIDKIRVSGTDYTLSATSSGGNPTVELTQAEYDALVSAGTVSADTYYIITDAQAGDLTQYWTSAQTNSAITQAVSGKQDTLVSSVNIKTINNESILGSGNINIQGGGKAVSAGTNISITTGETADTINCTLNASNGNGDYSFKEGFSTFANKRCAHAEGEQTLAGGAYSHAEGAYTTARADYSHTEGYNTNANNQYEHASGQYNVSNKANNTWGDSGNTLFSVGNGTSDSARHNAFEIRQNGDIYLSSGGTDIKLQDHLGGGGGGSITIDPSLDSGSTNAVANSAITNAINNRQAWRNGGYWGSFVRVDSETYNNRTYDKPMINRYMNYKGQTNLWEALDNLGFFVRINGKKIIAKEKTDQDLLDYDLVATSAITTSISSSSTDAQVPSAKAVNDKLGGLSLVKLTQAEYDALATKDSNTLYVING